MVENQDSLVEIAIKEMSKKRKPRTLANIAKEVFEIKGLSSAEAAAALPQFQIDFMLSGHFICCGEDRKGAKIWDLKNRQHSSLLDKEGVYVDPEEENEDVKNNELRDDIFVDENNSEYENDDIDDDDDDKEDEKDDIEEALGLYEEDDIEEDSYDDNDSEITLKK